jgi:hypothetical protein
MTNLQAQVILAGNALGAEIRGVDLSKEVGSEILRVIQEAFVERAVTFSGNQSI